VLVIAYFATSLIERSTAASWMMRPIDLARIMTMRYIIWNPSAGKTENDGVKITARSAQIAVEKWADYNDFNSNEYHIINGHPATVMVRDLDSSKALEWIVSGESIRKYTARLCEMKP
jgi:hypothetical protein